MKTQNRFIHFLLLCFLACSGCNKVSIVLGSGTDTKTDTDTELPSPPAPSFAVGIDELKLTPLVGSLDTSFFSSGHFEVDGMRTTNDDERYYDVASDSVGSIYTCGYGEKISTNDTADFIVAKYDSNGNLDTTFNGDGYLILNALGGVSKDDYCKKIIVIDDNKILAFGNSELSSGVAATLVRFDRNGVLDTTFGNNGILLLDNSYGVAPTPSNYAYAVTLDSKGKIILALRVKPDASNDSAILRLNQNGSVDTSFNAGNPVFITDVEGSGANDYIHDLVIGNDGSIYGVGYSYLNSSNFSGFLVKIDHEGNFVNSFGSSGILKSSRVKSRWFTVDFEGQGLIVGGQYDPGNNDVLISKFTTDGILDASYGVSGERVIVDAGGVGAQSDSFVTGLLDSQGSFYAISYNSNSTTISKLTNAGAVDLSFGNAGHLKLLSDAGASGAFRANGATVDPISRVLLFVGYVYNSPSFDGSVTKVR